MGHASACPRERSWAFSRLIPAPASHPRSRRRRRTRGLQRSHTAPRDRLVVTCHIFIHQALVLRLHRLQLLFEIEHQPRARLRGAVIAAARNAGLGGATSFELDPESDQIVINTTPPAVNQILAVEPTPDAPSGLTARVDAVTDNGNGTTTLAVTPGTPADAYASGTVKTDAPATVALTPAGTTSTGMTGPLVTRNQPKTSSSPTLNTAVPSVSPLTCTGGVTSDLQGLSVDHALTPQVAAVWNHPLFGGGGFYVGTGGLERFQFDLDGTITVNLGVAVSGASTCTLKLPKVKGSVPAGALGAVILTVAPTLTLQVTGKVDLRTSVTLTCGTEYRWLNGTESRLSYCHAKNQPLQLSADSGADATLTGALDSSVTLDEIAGITGSITAAAHAGYHPTGHPVVQIDANSTFDLGGCLACFWSGTPAHVTLVSSTLFDKILYTSNTPPNPVVASPLAVTTTTLSGAVVAQPYTSTLVATGGTAPLAWSITSGSLPSGLSLSASGSISGTPSTPGSVGFTVTVHDSTGATATAPLTLVVGGPGAIRAGSISAGAGHTCAVTTAGAVKCWGRNDYGGLGDGTTTDSTTPVDVVGLGSGVASVSAGDEDSCAVTTAGAVKCWGRNVEGELGDGTTTSSAAPVDVVGLGSGVASISAGTDHTCAVTTTGAVKCWGWNLDGELGDGTTTDSATPVDVVGLGSGVASISSGASHTCAVTTAGAVKCWGWNPYGQLGDGTTTNSTTPVGVVGLGSGVASVSAGDYHSCAVTTSGAVKCWGYNLYGELGDGTTTSSTTPVAVVGLP